MAAPKQKRIAMVKEESVPQDASYEKVELIGSANDMVGEHNIYRVGGYVTFTNGYAEVRADVAAELRKNGLVK